MLAALPLVAFALLWAWRARASADWRDAWVDAACAWGAILWLSTEALSAFHVLDGAATAVVWLVVVVAAVPYGARSLPGILRRLATDAAASPLEGRVVLAALAALALFTGIVGCLSAPNSFDAMTYHAARVMHWMQNRSVEFYPTHIQRQNHFPPWSEFVLLQLRLLAGSDRLFHLVQWFGVFGAAPVVARTASLLGANAGAQRFAALYSVSVPASLLQAVSTQNDATVGFWLAIFAYGALRLASGAADRVRCALVAGVGLGLALLTKSTATLFAFPFVLGLALCMLVREGRRALPVLASLAAATIAINLPHALRNGRDYASPLGPTVENYAPTPLRYTVDSPDAQSLALNAIRNLALHFAPPHRGLTLALEQRLRSLLEQLGWDPADPRSTWLERHRNPGSPAWGFYLRPHGANEYYTGAPVHVVLMGIAPLLLLRRRGHPRKPAMILLGVAAGAVLFCLLIRWQPWHVRLHLPLFTLAAPAVATAFAGTRALTRGWLALLLVLPAPHYLINNAMHPLADVLRRPRGVELFAGQRRLRESYGQVARFVAVAGHRSIGLVTTENSYEYPLWVLLEEFPGTRRIEHVSVPNVSARHARSAFSPDVVVCLACDPRPLLADPGLGPPFQLSRSLEPSSLVLAFPVRRGAASDALQTPRFLPSAGQGRRSAPRTGSR